MEIFARNISTEKIYDHRDSASLKQAALAQPEFESEKVKTVIVETKTRA